MLILVSASHYQFRKNTGAIPKQVGNDGVLKISKSTSQQIKNSPYGNLGNLLKSGLRFSTKAFLPSLPSSLR